jgi:hypothetical protein
MESPQEHVLCVRVVCFYDRGGGRRKRTREREDKALVLFELLLQGG